MPIAASRVMLVCPRCSEPTRVAKKLVQDKNVRVCKNCEEIIDKV
jgi:large subunit ribosomal protein L24